MGRIGTAGPRQALGLAAGRNHHALRDVFRDAPIGSQIIPVPEGSAEDMDTMRRSFRGNRGASLVIEGTAQATAAGMNPNIGQSPDQLSPQLDKTLADKLLTEAKGEIYNVFGILPGLTNPSTTGPMVREAQRHLAQLVLQPIVNLMPRRRPRSWARPSPSTWCGRCRPMTTAARRARRDHVAGHGAGERGGPGPGHHQGCAAIHRLGRLMLVMSPEMKRRLRRERNRERDALRGRVGAGRFHAMVKDLAALVRLAFEAGETASIFGLEGRCGQGCAPISACRAGAGPRPT